jgi:ABC-type amino acid transport substrate-binding protein
MGIIPACLLFLSISLPVFAEAPPTLSEPANDIETIVKRGKLIVAMYHEDTPPFYYLDKNNVLTGIDVALIKGFADLLGVAVEFDRSAKFLDDVIDKVEKNQADLAICKLSITFSRVRRVLFTKPYIRLHQGLLINRLKLAQQLHGRSREETIQNLTGKIGTVAKSSYVKYARQQLKGAEVVEYPSWNQAVDDVLKGNIVGAYRDEAEIKMIMRDRPDTTLRLLSVVLKDAEDPKGIATSYSHRNLKDLLNFYIDSLNLDLTADKVLTDYDNVIKSIENKTK